MAVMTVAHEHQTTKPPTVTRDKRAGGHDMITVMWGTLTIRVETAEARKLVNAIGAVLY